MLYLYSPTDNMKTTTPSIGPFSVVVKGRTHDAIAKGYVDNEGDPFFRIVISNGLSIDLYIGQEQFVPGEMLWYESHLKAHSHRAQQVGEALEAFLTDGAN
jgi:hypothetical protein